MDNLGINKQFDEMWNRSHGKKHAEVLMKRERSPVKNYSATVVIARFLLKSRLEREHRKLVQTSNSRANIKVEETKENSAVGNEVVQQIGPVVN